jgi:hypothetical protein
MGNLLALGGQLMLGLGLLVPAQSRLEVVAGPLTPNARTGPVVPEPRGVPACQRREEGIWACWSRG